MIREVCSCSAEIETDEDDAIALVREWRKKHLHYIQPTYISSTDNRNNHDVAPGFQRVQPDED
jgi:hypothetical protein